MENSLKRIREIIKKSDPNEDIQSEIDKIADDALKENEKRKTSPTIDRRKTLMIKVADKCTNCFGSGEVYDGSKVPCPRCGGSKIVKKYWISIDELHYWISRTLGYYNPKE